MKLRQLSTLGKLFFAGLLALCMLITYTYVKITHKETKQVQIVQEEDIPVTDDYVVERETVLSAVKKIAETATYSQSITRTYEDVDDSLLGKRVTEVKFAGYYKLGFDLNGLHIDNIVVNGDTVNVMLGDPILVSLKIPFDEVENKKTNGLIRKKMNVEEMKDLYSAAEQQIEEDIMSNEDILEQAKLHNEAVVRDDMMLKFPGVKKVVFY